MSSQARSGVWLVTPAWRRIELSELCFDQHAHVMDVLTAAGVETHHVVVADDENLELARARGWHTVEQDNRWLGRRFSDGIEYAFRHGAQYVVPIGSDSWIDPAYFLPLPEPGVVRTSRSYCVLTDAKLGRVQMPERSPAGPHMLTRELLQLVDGRPVNDRIEHGCDTSTVRNLEAASRRRMPWEWRDVHPYQYVGLRGWPTITTYFRLVNQWGVEELDDPWPVLRETFGPFVDRARTLLSELHTPHVAALHAQDGRRGLIGTK
jgi:hypothetical protein